MGEQPGWDKINVVKDYQVEINSVAADARSATVTITYQQYGSLSADGTFTAHPQALAVPLRVIYLDKKWLIHYLPESVLPQISKAAAIAHFQVLMNRAQANNETSTVEFYTKALKALGELN